MSEKYKVLIVCTGNTCRSPMAEGILRHLFKERSIDNIEVSSAGTSAVDGIPAAENGIIVCRDWGIDISNHLSRKLTQGMLESSDLVLAMSPDHLKTIRSVSPVDEKLYLVKSFPEKPNNLNMEAVDDPIGGSLEIYSRTFLELDEILRKALPTIIEFSKKK
ncbi:MAG: low molecular weight protein arginine phosphatase [candidate division Zixibacteria bacterium]|nr:low molecular weight protein arginine phosphatase [candidate division Zixibacteria bacterium]